MGERPACLREESDIQFEWDRDMLGCTGEGGTC